jgi:predicted XRE-type DNA-binding protein
MMTHNDVKIQLSRHIRKTMKDQQLSQTVVAELDGRLQQGKISAIINEKVAQYSVARLMRILTGLGMDVDIVIKPKKGKKGQIRVLPPLGQ